MKSVFSECHYEVLFSDFTNVWHEHLEGCDIEQRSKEVNPSLEIDLSKLLVHIHHCITECNNENVYDVQLASDLQLSLTVMSKLSGLPFCWNFLANPVSLDMIRHHLTEPLMAMVCELNWQKQELITLLKNKDREIVDLKAQGISVSRKKLETVTFDESSFSHSALQSDNLQSCIQNAASSVCSTDGQLLYNEIMKVGECRSAQIYTEHDEEDISTDGGSHSAVSSAASSASRNLIRSPSKEVETQRRLDLEKRLAEQEKKDSLKKKKKIKF